MTRSEGDDPVSDEEIFRVAKALQQQGGTFNENWQEAEVRERGYSLDDDVLKPADSLRDEGNLLDKDRMI